MSESQITCIVDVQDGIGNATVQISKFTHNFDCIKFIANKDFTNYSVVIITDAQGRVNIVPEGDNLKKTYNSEEKNTEILWYPQRQITCDDGVVIYQIAAYGTDDDNSIWYSKEGRIIVTDSIDTNELSAEVIGSSPNLLSQILTTVKKSETDLESVKESTNSNSYALTELTDSVSALYSDLSEIKSTVPNGEETYNPQSNLSQSGKAVAQAIASIVNSAPETLNTLDELARALGDDPNFATTIMTLLGGKVDTGIFDRTIGELQEDSMIHKSNVLNPHRVTKEQIGLSYVDNTSDKDKPISDAVRDELDNKVDKEDNKGLSTNDFTDQYKNQIEENAFNVGRVSDIVDENNYRIGNLDNLNTDKTDNLVDAINEIYEDIHQTPVTTIPATLEPNKAYNFGFVDNLSLSFPTTANDGDVIYITFFAEADEGKSPNLIIDTTNTTDIEIIPENSTGYEIFAKYNGNAIPYGIDDYWIVNYSEFTL